MPKFAGPAAQGRVRSRFELLLLDFFDNCEPPGGLGDLNRLLDLLPSSSRALPRKCRHPPERPRERQERPRAAKRRQEGSGIHLGAIWGGIWEPLEPEKPRKTTERSSKIKVFVIFSRRLKRAPTRSKWSSRSGQNASQGGLQGRQDGAKSRQGRPKRGPRRTGGAKKATGKLPSSREPPGSLWGASWKLSKHQF